MLFLFASSAFSSSENETFMSNSARAKKTTHKIFSSSNLYPIPF